MLLVVARGDALIRSYVDQVGSRMGERCDSILDLTVITLISPMNALDRAFSYFLCVRDVTVRLLQL